MAPMELDAVLTALQADGRLVHLEHLPARPARTAQLAVPLPAAVEARLPVDALWSHQVEAIDLVRRGTSVAVATGTASGKSLCYQLPIAEAVAAGVGGSGGPAGSAAEPATALLLFPTKALAQDQLRALAAGDWPGVVAATYDGDT